MKKLVLGLVLAAIAVGGSSFTNVKKKSVVENYFIQPISGIFVRANTANGNCINLGVGPYCKYAITPAGRSNIPSLAWYDSNQVEDYLAEGWLEMTQVSAKGLYFII